MEASTSSSQFRELEAGPVDGSVLYLQHKHRSGKESLMKVWSWINLAIGRPCVAAFDDLDPQFPYESRWDSERTWTETPSRNVLFYRNEFDLLPDDAVTWDPYKVVLRKDFLFPSERDWICKCKLILFWSFQNYVPDRVMRQFGFRSQHIPDPVILIPLKHDNWKNFLHESVELWNNRDNFVILERNPPTSLNEYEFWYWQITRRFILKETKREIVAYVPRAPLERDVVDGMYHALDAVDAIEHNRYDPEKVKMKCIGLRQMIHSLLGKNKLHRPSRPPILHSSEAHVEVEQEEGRQMDEEQRDETQRETHGPWDTSSSFQDPMQEEWPQWPMQQQQEEWPQWPMQQQQEEIIFGPSQQEEIIFGPSTQTQEQPPHPTSQTITYVRKAKRRPWR